MSLQVSALNYYPVKSCAGIPLAAAQLDSSGIANDREFMVVDAQSGKFISQRVKPRMCLVEPELSVGQLSLFANGMQSITIPVLSEGKSIDAYVRDIRCEAVDQGDESAKWLSEYLGGNYRLVRFKDGFERFVNDEKNSKVAFADAYPLLLISQESVIDLNSRIGYNLEMDRFRPNIVIAGAGEPYLEDKISKIRINGIEMDIVKPCERCNITLVDQQSGKMGKEPLAALNAYRRNERGKVEFGQNVIHKSQGVIFVGDKVDIVEYKR